LLTNPEADLAYFELKIHIRSGSR